MLGYPVGASGVPIPSKLYPLALVAPAGSASVATVAARVAAALVVRIGLVANASAAKFVGTRLKLAPLPVPNPVPSVHVVALDDGNVVQLPAVATLVTPDTTPETFVVTLSTGLVVQPLPFQVTVPEELGV